jgi:hypothetical protein
VSTCLPTARRPFLTFRALYLVAILQKGIHRERVSPRAHIYVLSAAASAAPMRMCAAAPAPHSRLLLSQKVHLRKALRLELAALPQESIRQQSMAAEWVLLVAHQTA